MDKLEDVIGRAQARFASPSIFETRPEDHRRDPSEGAITCLGFSWEDIVLGMLGEIERNAPEMKGRSFIWIVRARPGGVRVEFYDDDEAFARRLNEHAAAQAANPNGPQVHAGRVSRLRRV